MSLSHITGTLHHHDGTTQEFLLTDDGYQQWGGTREDLAANVDALESLAWAIEEHIVPEPPADEPDEDDE